MRLLLARHGETDWNARGQIQGQSDTTLNDRGRAQAAELARRLLAAGERVERIYASPQKRALETAQIAGGLLGLTPEPVEGLREISFGPTGRDMPGPRSRSAGGRSTGAMRPTASA